VRRSALQREERVSLACFYTPPPPSPEGDPEVRDPPSPDEQAPVRDPPKGPPMS
jgi:hypothetical protein